MALALGVDTGGTYTDAVLIRDGEVLVAKAKSLTTRHDLAEGVGGAVRAVLAQAQVDPAEIGMAALSTTLATNALVEGQGGSVALIYIGFRDGDIAKHGLAEALRGDPVLEIAGGHSHAGAEAASLDLEALRAWVQGDGAGASGYAVAAQFATRNPAHELAAAAVISEMTGAPVTCSHMLSARLNGPKRALTALLNARLIGMIDRLIDRAASELERIGVTAPMMVVRGDGALMSAGQARQRPIETILSGPAASLVGAGWLTGSREALVSDIGGTTTDVAVLREGRPAIDPDGAQVGGFRTMVEAVAMRTWGLGGDSETRPVTEGLQGGVVLGPRRLVPVALVAQQAPALAHATLDAQLAGSAPGEHDARFVKCQQAGPDPRRDPREAEMLTRIGPTWRPVGDVLRSRRDYGVLKRLQERGQVQLGGVTPTDAVHVLGGHAPWDAEAATKALTLLARKRAGHGNALAADATDMATQILSQMTEQSARALLEAALAEEADPLGPDAAQLARNPVLQAGLAGRSGLVQISARLAADVIALGASAGVHYPAVGRRLRARCFVPEHADVANAIGAVVGELAFRKRGTVTAPSEGRFRAHLPDGPQDFPQAEAAMACLEAHLEAEARAEAQTAGAEDLARHVAREVKTAHLEAREIFVEAELVVELRGRPRFAAT